MSWEAGPLIAAVLVGTLLAFASVANAASLVIGQVAPLSGVDANQARAYSAGMQLLLNSINRAGGVNGHTFTLVTADDGGQPETTLNETKRLLDENGPLVLSGYFGNPNISALVGSGILEKNRVPVVGYRAADIRPEYPYLYNTRANLDDEMAKLIGHLATIGVNRVALLYEDGPSASKLIAAARDHAAKSHITIVEAVSHLPGSARVAPAVASIAKAAPQAVLMVSGGGATAAFIEQYRGAGGTAQLFAHSGADVEQMSARLAEEQMQGVAIAQVTPSPYRISSRLAKELQDAVNKSDKPTPLSYAMMEGYITAKVIVEAIRRQGAGRPERE